MRLAIKQLGSSIPGFISAATLKGSRIARNNIAQVYRQQGLNIQIAQHGAEAAGYEFWQLLVTHKIRVFASLAGFLAAYRIGDEEAPLLHCCQALIPLFLSCGRKPALRPPNYRSWDESSRGPLAWMA